MSRWRIVKIKNLPALPWAELSYYPGLEAPVGNLKQTVYKKQDTHCCRNQCVLVSFLPFYALSVVTEIAEILLSLCVSSINMFPVKFWITRLLSHCSGSRSGSLWVQGQSIQKEFQDSHGTYGDCLLENQKKTNTKFGIALGYFKVFMFCNIMTFSVFTVLFNNSIFL